MMFKQATLLLTIFFSAGVSSRFLPSVVNADVRVNTGNSGGGFDINDMLRQVNQVRAKVGARPLRINQQLMKSAQSHCQDQAQSQKMSHSGSDGSDFEDRNEATGYNVKAGAENVAYNQKTVSDVMESWINSPGHYKNMVDPKYTDFGAGMKNYYWTQEFGTQS